MLLAKPETKVGLFSLTALVVLISLFFWLNKTELFNRGAEIEAAFDRIEGLRPGAPVKYIGVDVGRVSKIYFELQKVIVVIRLQPDFEIPRTTKAIIASAGVVGDKYLELIPLKPGETDGPGGDRIKGEAPTSLDEFYASAYEIMTSVKQIVNSLNEILSDREVTDSLKNAIIRINRITATLDRLTVDSEPQIAELLRNMNLAALKIAKITADADRMLTRFDNDGETIANLQQALRHINKISANLDQFSEIVSAKGSDIGLLIDDARRTMQSIDQAAQTVNQVINDLNSDESGISDVKETLEQAGAAAQKVDDYVQRLERIKISSGLGVGYDHHEDLTVDYALNLNLSERDSILFQIENIGPDSLTSLQLGAKNQSLLGRAGLYRNEFGLGLNYWVTPQFILGGDLWDTDSPNFGLTAAWRMTDQWSLFFSGSSNLEEPDYNWSLKWWYSF